MKPTLNNHEPVLIAPSRIQAAIDQFISLADVSPSDQDESYIVDGVAVISVEGILARGVEDYEAFGFADYGRIADQVEEAEEDPRVQTILLDIDSPGGTVNGCLECVARLGAIQKTLVAYSSGLMCSAAYWLATSADLIFCSPSASVGSVGCYVASYDLSGMFNAAGVKVDVISSGENKAIGYPGTSLTPDQRAILQASVDHIADKFKDAVVESRDSVELPLDGRDVIGDVAAQVGFVDDVMNTIDDVIEFVKNTK